MEKEFQDRGVLNTDALLLDFARVDVQDRLADMVCRDVPAPTGAISVDKWQEHTDFGLCRSAVWRNFCDRELYVDIDGWQRCDGAAVPEISIYIDEGLTLTSARARRFAALVIEAADELDKLAGPIGLDNAQGVDQTDPEPVSPVSYPTSSLQQYSLPAPVGYRRRRLADLAQRRWNLPGDPAHPALPRPLGGPRTRRPRAQPM